MDCMCGVVLHRELAMDIHRCDPSCNLAMDIHRCDPNCILAMDIHRCGPSCILVMDIHTFGMPFLTCPWTFAPV